MIALTNKGIISQIEQGKFPGIVPLEELASDSRLKFKARENFMEFIPYPRDLYDQLGLERDFVFWGDVPKCWFTHTETQARRESLRTSVKNSKMVQRSKNPYTSYLHEGKTYSPESMLVLKTVFEPSNIKTNNLMLTNAEGTRRIDTRELEKQQREATHKRMKGWKGRGSENIMREERKIKNQNARAIRVRDELRLIDYNSPSLLGREGDTLIVRRYKQVPTLSYTSSGFVGLWIRPDDNSPALHQTEQSLMRELRKYHERDLDQFLRGEDKTPCQHPALKNK